MPKDQSDLILENSENLAPKAKPSGKNQLLTLMLMSLTLLILIYAGYYLYNQLSQYSLISDLPVIKPTTQPKKVAKLNVPRAIMSPTNTAPKPRKLFFFQLIDSNLIPLTQTEVIPPWGSSTAQLISNDPDSYYILEDQVLKLNSLTQNQTLSEISLPFLKDRAQTNINKINSDSIWISSLITPMGATTSLAKINFQTQEIIQLDKPFVAESRYGRTDVLHDHNNIQFLETEGGDGCGGFGKLIKYENNLTTEFLEIGSGCVNAPRLVGFSTVTNSAIIYSVVPDTYENPHSKLVSLMQVDEDGKSNTLYDLKGLLEYDTQFVLSESTSQIAILKNDQVITLDLQSKDASSSSLSQSIEPIALKFTWEADNNLYAVDDQNKDLIKINPFTGEVNKINFSQIKFVHNDPLLHILNSYNEKPILYYYEPRYYDRG